MSRPEIHQLNSSIHAPDTVYTSETLNNPNRIPMDVIVDEIVAILKILAFGDAISGDQQVNLAILGHGLDLRSILRDRRKVRENVVKFVFSETGLAAA